MLDGIRLEQQGVPAAVICTDAFDGSAHTTTSTHGIPWYPFAIIEHPIGRRTDEELRKAAAEVLQRVESLLAGDVAREREPAS